MSRVYEPKSTAPSGKGNGVKKPAASRRSATSAAKQATTPAAEDQGANEYLENNYMRLSREQEGIIEIGTAKMHEAIEPWGEIRSDWEGLAAMEYSEYRKTVEAIRADLTRAYNEMRSEFVNSETRYTQEVLGRNVHKIVPIRHEFAGAEIARQLNRDYFPQYFKELMVMHPLSGVPELKALMAAYAGVEISSAPHVYKLRTIGGVEAGAGEGLSAGGAVKQFSIRYSNDLGMKWTRNVSGGYIKGGLGASASPVEVNIDSSWGNDGLSAGKAESRKYYPPSYFDLVRVSGSGAGSNRYAAGSMTFGDLRFDMTGLSGKMGTAAVPGVGVEAVPLGMFGGGDVYNARGLDDAKEVQEKKREGGWIGVIGAKIYFRTEEMGLDRDDHRSLDRVVGGIVNHDRYYPGDACKIHTQGFASEAWATPISSARNYHLDTRKIDAEETGSAEKSQKKRNLLNKKLAASRALMVNSVLENKLASKRTSAKISYISYNPEIIRSGSPAEDRNEPTDRYVKVVVAYPKNEQMTQTK